VAYDENLDGVHPRDFSNDFEDDEGVLFVPNDEPGEWLMKNFRQLLSFTPRENHPKNIEMIVRNAIRRAWGAKVDEITEMRVVGAVNGESIFRDVTVFSRNITDS
jgi:hypothetical protein